MQLRYRYKAKCYKTEFTCLLTYVKKINCYLHTDILRRGSSSEAVVDLPAGQKRCSGPSYMARFLATGVLSSFRVRWGGWSPSWLVPLRATDESRSKLIFPSGLGYSIGVQSLAGFSWFASRPARDWAWPVTKCWFFSAEIRRPDTLPKRNYWYCASSHHIEKKTKNYTAPLHIQYVVYIHI